jgi:hypothetical protein
MIYNTQVHGTIPGNYSAWNSDTLITV